MNPEREPESMPEPVETAPPESKTLEQTGEHLETPVVAPVEQEVNPERGEIIERFGELRGEITRGLFDSGAVDTALGTARARGKDLVEKALRDRRAPGKESAGKKSIVQVGLSWASKVAMMAGFEKGGQRSYVAGREVSLLEKGAGLASATGFDKISHVMKRTAQFLKENRELTELAGKHADGIIGDSLDLLHSAA